MDYINIDDLDKDLYFEFYLDYNLFYRFNYMHEQTEYSLLALSREIAHQLLRHYRIRVFSGISSDDTILVFGLIGSVNEHCILDVDQAERYATDYPLNLLYKEDRFTENLYINLILILANNIKSTIFREKFFENIYTVQQRSLHPVWPVFFEDTLQLSPLIDGKINRLNNRISQLNNYVNNEFKEQMKLKLANDLIKFNEGLDKKIEKSLTMYSGFLKKIHRATMDLLKASASNEKIFSMHVDTNLIDDNQKFINFCYGDIEFIEEEVLHNFLKYFIMKHHTINDNEINLGKINAHFRNRYNSILDLKGKISKSILEQIEKLQSI